MICGCLHLPVPQNLTLPLRSMHVLKFNTKLYFCVWILCLNPEKIVLVIAILVLTWRATTEDFCFSLCNIVDNWVVVRECAVDSPKNVLIPPVSEGPTGGTEGKFTAIGKGTVQVIFVYVHMFFKESALKGSLKMQTVKSVCPLQCMYIYINTNLHTIPNHTMPPFH